jgi:phosphoketolase
VLLTAVGAYQLAHALRASARLTERGVAHGVNYLLEPGRFRSPRGSREAAHVAPKAVRDRLYPPSTPSRVFLTHTRPEALLGAIHPVCTGPHTVGLGFTNHGGTLDTGGMLFVNGVTWAHALDAVARLLGMDRAALLTEAERAALDHRASPQGVLI